MEFESENWEQSKENVLPLKSGRKLSVLQTSDQQTKEQLAQQKHVFESELRLYSGDDELEVWCKYIKWVEQYFPTGGQGGNLCQLLKQCVQRFVKESKYKNDERYIDCWLKYVRFLPSSFEVFMQMDALEIGHKSAAFYESWSWHLEQIGNFRRANKIIQEGIDNNALPMNVLIETQKRLCRKLVEGYETTDQDEHVEDFRNTLGTLQAVGKKQAAPVSRIGSARAPQPLSISNSQKTQAQSSQSVSNQVFVDENCRPSTKPSVHPTSLPSLMWERENRTNPQTWNKAKLKSSTHCPINPSKPHFSVHQDENVPSDSGRKLINGFTTVLRGSRAQTKVYFIEPDDPNKLFTCDIQKLYRGAEEFQAEEIAAARWFKNQQQKKEEQEMLDMQRDVRDLKVQAATLVKKPVGLQNREVPEASVLTDIKADSCVVPAQSTKSALPLESSPTRDVLALWNATLSHPSREDVSNSSCGSNHSSNRSVQKLGDKKGIQVFVDNPEVVLSKSINRVPISKEVATDQKRNQTDNCQKFVEKKGIPIFVDNLEVDLPKSSIKLTEKQTDENCKENQIPTNYSQTDSQQASPHNILQPTDRPIPFGVEEDGDDEFEDDDEDDLAVHPLPNDEACHTIAPLTSRQHFEMAAKLTSTPFHGFTNSKAISAIKPTKAEKTDMFKTPGTTVNTGLSPIVEASREASKSSSCTTSSSGSSLAVSSRRITANSKSLLGQSTGFIKPSVVDPYDAELISTLLNSVNIESREGILFIDQKLPRLQKNKTLEIGSWKVHVSSQLAKGGEGVTFKAEAIQSKSDCPKEVVLKVKSDTILWEFYILSEVMKRTIDVPHIPDIRESIGSVIVAPVYQNCHILMTEYCPKGTLLDFANMYRRNNRIIPESVVLYLTWEILQIVHSLHTSNIVHGDVKPDNFVFLAFPSEVCFNKTRCMRLIDFGRSIDLSMFPKGTTFNGQAKTDKFVCPNMREKRPWIFQPDYYGILGTIHILLFPEYMTSIKVGESYDITKKFKRQWQTHFWNKLFVTLLNVPDCDHFPDLTDFTAELQKKLAMMNMELITEGNKYYSLLKSSNKC